MGQIGVDAPVAFLVGPGQRIASDRGTESGVIELVLNRLQAGLDVAKTLPEGQLGKGHTQKLIPTGEPTHSVLPSVATRATVELMRRQEVHQLRK